MIPSPSPPSVEPTPVFAAVASSTRQLFSILRTCGWQSRAEIELLPEGIKVTVEDSRVMQGHNPDSFICFLGITIL